MKLLDELASEHAAIMNMFQHVIDLGIVTPEAQGTLAALKGLLLSHLRKENDFFYPVLRQTAKNDCTLAEQLTAHGRELEAVYGLAFRFFDKYAEGGSGREFARELGMIFASLRERVRREEQTLFAEYRKRLSADKQ